MFYCEPCRKERDWPESIATSAGRCELCGNARYCYDRKSSSLPLPKEKIIPTTPVRDDEHDNATPDKKDRIDKFLALFTEEERAGWGDHQAPDWVVLGITYFLGQDPAHQELMRRLKESGD